MKKNNIKLVDDMVGAVIKKDLHILNSAASAVIAKISDSSSQHFINV